MKKKSLIIILFFLMSVLLSGCIDKYKKDYESAVELFESGDYKTAAEMFDGLGDYQDSEENKKQSLYLYAGECLEKQDFDEAIKIYDSINNYYDSSEKKQEAGNEKFYVSAVGLYNSEKYQESKDIFESIKNYKDSDNYIAGIIYIQALDIINNDPDTAVDMLISIRNYQGTGELADDILINKALSYMQEKYYEKAIYILERIEVPETTGHQSSAELFELCNKNIKYNQAVDDFNRDKLDSSYSAFVGLGDFSEGADYVKYLDAKKDAEAQKYGEAAEKFLSLSEFIHKNDLDESAYEECLYLYYDQQFQLGNKDLSKLSLMPLDDKIKSAYENEWRIKRRNSLWKTINNDDDLNIYYYKTDTSKNIIDVTGTGIYLNIGMAKYGAELLAGKIFKDVPVFFLADSPEKVRYIVNFDCTAKFYAPYDDGTLGYQTTSTIIIKDTITGQILFSKSYSVDPPYQTKIIGDVYPSFNFLEKKEDGLSVYEKDIRPVLEILWENIFIKNT